MFLLAPIALLLLALLLLALLPLVAGGLVAGVGVALCAAATGNKAAVRAAAEVAKRPDTGMPAGPANTHPVPLREARLANDASSPPASAGVCPASESDDLDTRNPATNTSTGTPAGAGVGKATGIMPAISPMHGLPPSASPAPSRGLALGVSHGWAGRPRLPLPRSERAYGPDYASCTAGLRPRIKSGDADNKTGVACSTTPPALLC